MLSHTFETGQTHGTTVTAGNSATGGTPFDTVTIGTGATLTYEGVSTLRGALSLRYTTTGVSVQASASWASGTVGSLARVYARITVQPITVPSQTSIIRLRSAGTQVGRLTINPTTGTISLRNTANSEIIKSVGGQIADYGSAPWRVAFDITPGSSTGGVLYIFRDPTSAVPDETVPFSGADMGPGNVDEVFVGQVANLADVDMIVDDLAVSNTVMPGPAGQGRTFGGTITATGTLVAGRALDRGGSDTLTAGDATGRVTAATRAATGAVAAADGGNAAVLRPRAAADTAAVADTLGYSLTLVTPSATDAVSLTGTVARTATSTRAAAGTITVADDATTGNTYAGDAADTITAVSAATTAGSCTRAANGNLTLTDTPSGALATARAAMGGAGFADTGYASHVQFVDAADSVTVAGVAGRVANLRGTATDTVTVPAAVTPRRDLGRSLANGATLLDAATRTSARPRTLAGTVTFGFLTARGHIHTRNVTNPLTLADTAAWFGNTPPGAVITSRTSVTMTGRVAGIRDTTVAALIRRSR